MENFFGKVIKIVSGDKGGIKDYWIDDSKCKVCYECESAFSQWNRRHHCRICGRVFCGNCTQNSIPPPRESADQQWLRVCNYCYRVRQRSDQPSVRAQQQHAASRGVGGAVLAKSGSLRQLLDTAGSLSAGSEGSVSSGGVARTRSGASLGRWSRGGQSSVHRITSGDLSWSVPPPLEDDFGMSLADRDARLLYQQQLEAGALQPDAPQQANSLGEVHRHLFCSVADAHLRAVVQQLLMAESVPQPELWAPIVSGAAQAVAAYLAPSQMYGNGQHDPRQSVKMKKVADVGRPGDTCVVTGVVVRKGLVHRKMRSYIEYPKVLLLAGSLEYQRETNKLSSFDLMDHDRQYLANAVARLSVLKPDVVLVEGSVARMAQEDLLSRNISVAQKIKAKVLERLARCMGVKVTPTVEHLSPATAHLYLGDCKVFRVEAETIETAGAAPAAAPAAPAAPAAAPAPADAGGAGTAETGASASQAPTPEDEPQPSETAAAGGEAMQGGGGGGGGGDSSSQPAPPPEPPEPPPAVAPRSVPESQQGNYTSLSAAMMMKALGSGPNAAAAVACVSAGSGVASTVVRSAGVVATATAGGSFSSATAGGDRPGGAAVAVAAGDARGAAAAAPGSHPALGRTGPAPSPAGPPAPPQVTLMYFEGCRPTTATVLLKGAGVELLKRLKPVVGFAVLTAWNQRLESSFLTDLLTAAVVAAGEEAHAASVAGSPGSGLQTAPALNLTSMASGPLPPSPPAPSLNLSLSFFRQHAERAVRASVLAASASGAPGILLSISPHCNAWDDSLIAEWQQQGFTFPHQMQPLALPDSQQQPQQPQQPAPLARSGGEGGPPGEAGAAAVAASGPGELGRAAAASPSPPASAAAAAAAAASELRDPAATAAATVSGAAVGAPELEQEMTFALAEDASGIEGAAAAPAVPAAPAAEVQPAPEAAGGAEGAQQLAATAAAEPQSPPPPAHAPSAMTMNSPFALANAPLVGAEAGQGLGGDEGAAPGQGDEPPAADAAAAAAGPVVEGQAEVVVVPEDASGAGASVAVPAAGTGPVEESAGAGAAAVEEEAVEKQQTVAAATQQQQQALPQQSAVMVLQGQRIYNHQRIFVTCMFRRSRDRNLCDPFQVKQIDFYHRSSDVPLIRYIKMCTQLGWTCPGAGCPDPFTSHESVFFFGGRKLTIFYSTLPPVQALPGEEKNQIWHWTRPIGRGRDGASWCRRVPLSQDSCYISMGRFLELSFTADGLDVFGRSLHFDHVRYFGLGRTLVCMFPERTSVYVMQLPDVIMSYSQQAQSKWLRQEGSELVQEANDAFDLIELMLGESPYFGGAGGGSWEVAGVSVLQSAGAAAADGDAATPAAVVLTPLMVAVRKDRQSFLSLVADCMERSAPLPYPQHGSSGGGAVPWDEQVIGGVRGLNRLRSVLAKAVLQWASRLQDPAGFAAHYNRVTSGVAPQGRLAPRGQPQPAPPPPPPPPPHLAAAASPQGPSPTATSFAPSDAAPFAPSTGPFREEHSFAASEGSVSLFGLATPALAAYRLGLMSGHTGTGAASETIGFSSAVASLEPVIQEPSAGTTAHALPIPIVPHTNGPLSVLAVAEMVAQQELRGGAELLEGSRALLGGGGTSATAAAAPPPSSRPGPTRGPSRPDLPTTSPTAAAVAGTAEAPQAAPAQPAAPRTQQPGSGESGPAPGGARLPSIAAGSSSKRLSLVGRVSVGGGAIPGLDGPGPAAAAAAAAGGVRGTSLPRSTSVSTIGDLADMSYMGGIGGDSGAEDNDEAVEEADEEEEEEPDHDSFLAFMGSQGGAAFQRGPMRRSGTAARRSSALGDRAGGDSGDEVADEVADGAYYYRALFSHGTAADGGEEGHPHQHPQQVLQGAAGVSGLTIQVASATAAAAAGAIVVASGSAVHSPAAAAGATLLAAAAPVPIGAAAAAADGPPVPLVPAPETFAGFGPTDVATAIAAPSSRRQLLLNVRRRLESAAAATLGGGVLARGFIPLPGRATMSLGVNDIVIPIFDSEPTSIIAYALSTRGYQQQINAGYKAIFGKARADSSRDREPTAPAADPVVPEQQPPSAAAYGLATNGGEAGGQQQPAAAGASFPSGLPQGPPLGATLGTSTAPHHHATHSHQHSGSAGASFPSPSGSPPPAAQPPPPLLCPPAASPDADWWTVLTSREACHVRVAFEDEARSMPWARAKFSVVAHFAPQFAELRRRCIQGGEGAYVASMCRCKRWESRGGKSNAYFAKTRDDRYIIKSLSKSEKASLMNFAPHYFTHMGRHLLNRDSPTCLAKILGVYSVIFKPQPGATGLEAGAGGGPSGAAASAALIKELKDREFTQDLLVMENCFYDRPVARIYDLKGSERNRFNADAASRPEDSLEVHLDDNLRRSVHTNPIFVDARSRHEMEQAVWADTSFLSGQDVMDYSLLVGVDKDNGVLALAIIDFIRQYTWDKQLETWVKSSGMLGGNGKEPTIISPKQYMRRFRAAMQQYFTAVPGSAGSEVPKDPDANV